MMDITKTIIETNRLKLRYLTVDDTPAIFNNINHDKEVLTYFIDNYCENIDEMILSKNIELSINQNRYFLAIVNKKTGEVMGMILTCNTPNKIFNSVEVGYALGKKYWNQGYATEALKAMINFLFDQGIHKVIVTHLIGNEASKKVINKCNMIYEGRKIDEVYYHDKYYDVDCYYLINKK